MSALDSVDKQLLQSYDSYMLKGGKLTLEQYRANYFSKLEPISDDKFMTYYTAYVTYRARHSTGRMMTFSEYTRRIQRFERQREGLTIEEVPTEEKEGGQEEEVEEEQLVSADDVSQLQRDVDEAEPVLSLTSGVKVRDGLLKRWQRNGTTGMNIDQRNKLIESMRDLCRASDMKAMKNANRFDKSNLMALSSGCGYNRHDRLRHTHRLESAHSATLAQGGGPAHLVIHRFPSTGAVQRELVYNGDYDDSSMQIYHTFVSSKGLINWLKNKFTRYTGRGLPKGLNEFFENSDNFDDAVDLAKQTFMDEDGEEYSKEQIDTNLRKLDQEQLDLLFALTQYLCNKVKRGDVSKLPSGACSLQSLHAATTRHAGRDLRDAQAIAEKAMIYGFGSLTRTERRRLYAAMTSNTTYPRSRAALVSGADVRQGTHNANVDTPMLRSWDEWKAEEIRKLLIEKIMAYDKQIKAGIRLAPSQPFQNIDSSQSSFVRDLRSVYGSDIERANRGVGIWLIPTDADYAADTKNRSMTLGYFSHFFVDLNPSSKLGKLNRAAVEEAQEDDADSIMLITNSSTRVYSADLFPSVELRQDLHNSLYAFLADIKPDPERDLTRAIQIERIPDSLFTVTAESK